jgi:glucose/galactose transporter
LPEIDTDKEEGEVAEKNINKKSVFQFPQLVQGVLALFLYVGAEVIAGDTIISYGSYQGIPLETSKFFTTCTLLAMILGYIIGIVTIPKYLTQEKALRICALLGVLFSAGAVFTGGYVSVFFIALLGLANSLMWPAIWPLAIDGLGRFTKIGSSLLIMAIAGGALLPLVYGRLADILDPRQAYWVLIPCYLYILYYAVSGYRKR